MYRIVGIGELLWDLLPSGPRLGGAPANFACHARSLGADSAIVSRIGNDELGREALNILGNRGVHLECIEIDQQLPTGTVSVTLDDSGVPQFVIHEGVAWDALVTTPMSQSFVEQADAICFGSLGQRSSISERCIQQLAGSTKPNSLRVFDINLRQHYFSRQVIERSLQLANILKINDEELPVLVKIFNLPEDEKAQIESLAEQFGLDLVALTRGAKGSLLFQTGEWSEHGGFQAEVADTIGAGDSFTAALTLGKLAGWPLNLINEHSNRVAAFVCSQHGATPELPASIAETFKAVT